MYTRLDYVDGKRRAHTRAVHHLCPAQPNRNSGRLQWRWSRVVQSASVRYWNLPKILARLAAAVLDESRFIIWNISRFMKPFQALQIMKPPSSLVSKYAWNSNRVASELKASPLWPVYLQLVSTGHLTTNHKSYTYWLCRIKVDVFRKWLRNGATLIHYG